MNREKYIAEKATGNVLSTYGVSCAIAAAAGVTIMLVAARYGSDLWVIPEVLLGASILFVFGYLTLCYFDEERTHYKLAKQHKLKQN